MKALSKNALSLLAAVIAATDSEQGFDYVAPNYAAPKELKEAGFIEVNEGMQNPNDAAQFATRVTDAGRQYAKTGEFTSGEEETDTTGNGTSDAKAPRREFQIDENVALPEKAKRKVGTRELVYPFDQLPVGASFFVPDSDFPKGDAYKAMGSTVNTANKRYAVETGETRPNRRNKDKQVPVLRQERKFVLRRWTQDGVEGARVFRVELDHAEDESASEE